MKIDNHGNAKVFDKNGKLIREISDTDSREKQAPEYLAALKHFFDAVNKTSRPDEAKKQLLENLKKLNPKFETSL